MPFTPLMVCNGGMAKANEVPEVSYAELRAWIVASLHAGCRLAALVGMPANGGARLLAVLANDVQGRLLVASAVVGESYPALTPECPQAHLFEREIAEQCGIVPLGHPWLKPIRFHKSYRAGHDAWNRAADADILPSVMDFFQVRGEEVHEVAVGPVHAGIIEPGHFRFQCHGEDVMHLEISLGYQHRGVERRLVGGPDARTIHYMETLAGDTSVGHALAYAQAAEALGHCAVPPRAYAVRAIALELERLANHTGDLGALAGDVAFLPTASFCGRIRGDFLNMTALLCGSRFGRGMVRPGGTGFDVDAVRLAQLRDKLELAATDLAGAVELLWQSTSVTNRFEHTGTLSLAMCKDLGLVGVAARACGASVDVRATLPTGSYAAVPPPCTATDTGDVLARAQARWHDAQWSIEFIRAQIAAVEDGDTHAPCGGLEPEALAVSLVEGWRGELCHVALTDDRGKFAFYKVVDPSFHNWMGLAIAMRNQPISDFPLCNKSFNLSYCGHDL